MSGEDDAPRLPDLILERYRLGELPPDEGERLARRLERDAELRRRLQALEASDGQIRGQLLPERLAERVQAHLERRRAWPLRPAGLGRRPVPVALAAALLVAVLAPSALGPPPPSPAPDTPATPATSAPGDRLKGLRPALALFRKTADGTEVLAEGTLVRQGDLVRLAYRAAGRAHGVVLSIDGRGVVTRHLPSRGPRAARLRTSGTVLLDDAYELDDAPHRECFFFVTSETPFDVAPVMEVARRTAISGSAAPTLGLPAPLETSVFCVEKGAGS